MSAPQQPRFSPEATAAFAEIVARHDRGEAIEFEREFNTHEDLASELRALHANWKRLDSILGGLQVGESAIDELERELSRRDTPPDVATKADLERLSSPERARKRYVVRERLARGGMGEIWRVFDADLERDLAMKVIRTRAGEGSNTPDGKLLRRFLFEARLTGRLDHPGIVPVHDIGIDSDGRLYFTMPLVRGRSLSEILELAREGKEGWTRSRVLEIVLKVCDTLAFAHVQGVVHRDLKPQNVMVGRFGETYVMDWGLARVLSELDEIDRGEVLGTPAYMAPEQAKGKLDDVGPRSDIYALGSILYQLLAGRMPYADHEGDSGRGVLDAVRAGPPPRLETLALTAPLELVAIAKKAMVRSPDGRYADMEAMAVDLRAYMEGRVVRAHEAGVLAQLRKWYVRNRVITLTLLVSIAVLGAGALWFDYAQDKSAGEITRLSDLRRLEELEARADRMWPAVPSNEAAFEAWLREAEELAARAPLHEAELARLREQSGRSGEDEGASSEARWQIDALSTLVTRMSRFREPFAGLGTIANVRQRLEDSRRIASASLVDAAAKWTAAIAEIRDPVQCPVYRGLVIAPQFGLVPLGRDHDSGLFEFAQLASGPPAQRATNGRLVLSPDSGIVLVLLPGGVFHMGSQAPVPGHPSGPPTDPNAEADELPRTPIEIAPFFAAKFETTRAQWAALSALEPLHDGDLFEPQRSISWTECARTLRRSGLVLPTEAQWEYAARAGTTSRWSCGVEPGSLRGVANGGNTGDPRLGSESIAGAPMRVDALKANPFGLVHVHGNVAEWTRDVFAPYTRAPRSGDGERSVPENGMRSVRGGSFDSSAANLRSAARDAVAKDNHDPHIGVRVARAIDP